MTGVIYADVLFILNTYITYAILLLTGLFLQASPKRLRLLFASIIGGFASLLILIPQVSDTFLGVVRLVLCLGLPLVSFSYKGIRVLIRQMTVFLIINFIFAGIMFALWYFVNPKAMYYNTGIVYFDIDAMSLIVITAVCYFTVKLFSRITRQRAPKNTIYDVYITIENEELYLKGFLDTGNCLKDPFTSSDVIIADRRALQKYFPLKQDMNSIIESSSLKIRYLPCTTVSGSSLLPVFRCDKVKIKGIESEFCCKDVIIAVSDKQIKNGEFQALLPAGIFLNKGEDYEEAKRFTVRDNI